MFRSSAIALPGPSFWYFVFFLLLIFIDKVFFYQGHYGFDDMAYASLANDLQNGDLSLIQTHYSYRWALLFPLAFVYKIFGINDFSSSLPAIFAGIGACFLMYKLLRKESPWLLVLAIMIFCCQKWNYHYLERIMPDVFVSLGIFGSLYCIHKLYFEKTENKWLPFHFSCFVFFSFLAKETILILAPLYLFLLGIDLFKKKHLTFWFKSISSSLLLMGLYFAIVYGFTGNPIERIVQIKNNSYDNPCSYDILPFSHTLNRISKELILEWLKSGMLIWVSLNGLILLTKLRKHYLSFRHPWQFWSFSLFLALVCANFMSISHEHYVPLCPDPRHFIFLAPILTISAIYSFRYFMRKKYTADLFFLAFLSVGFSLLLLKFGLSKIVPVLILASALIIAVLRYIKIIDRNHTLILFVIALFGLSLFNKNNDAYRKQKAFIKNEIISSIKGNGIIYTNNAQSRMGNYYVGFDQSKYKFLPYEDFRPNAFPNKKQYVLLNAYTCELAGTPWEKLPKYVQAHRKNENEFKKDASSRLYIMDQNIMNEFPLVSQD